MLVYVLNYFLIPIYNYLVKNKKVFFLLMSCQLFLVLAYRAPDLCIDYPGYANGFEYISKLSFLDLLPRLRLLSDAVLPSPFSFESGYVVLNWIVAFLGGSFHTFLILHAAFCVYAYSKFISRYSKMPWLSVAIFVSFDFYIYIFGILRHTLSLAFLLFAIPYLEKKKPFKALLFMLLAFSMHKSSIIFVVMLVFIYVRVTKKRFALFTVLCAVAAFLGKNFFKKLITTALTVAGRTSYIKNMTDPKLNLYILFLFLTALLVYLLFDFDFSSDDWATNIILGGFLMSLPMAILAMYSDNIGRSGQFFAIMLIPLIPNVLYQHKSREDKQIGTVLVYVMLLFFMMHRLNATDFYVPYRSIFSVLSGACLLG